MWCLSRHEYDRVEHRHYARSSAIYTSNSGMHTAFIQVSLKEDHKTSSFAYMQRLRERFANDFPEVSTYFQTVDWLIPSLTRENPLRSIFESGQ